MCPEAAVECPLIAKSVGAERGNEQTKQQRPSGLSRTLQRDSQLPRLIPPSGPTGAISAGQAIMRKHGHRTGRWATKEFSLARDHVGPRKKNIRVALAHLTEARVGVLPLTLHTPDYTFTFIKSQTGSVVRTGIHARGQSVGTPHKIASALDTQA